MDKPFWPDDSEYSSSLVSDVFEFDCESHKWRQASYRLEQKPTFHNLRPGYALCLKYKLCIYYILLSYESSK